MPFESAMLDMRPLASCLAITLILAAAAARPSRAQGTEPSACVSATGPDVTQRTSDRGAVRSRVAAPGDSSARMRSDSARSTNPTVRLVASVQAQEVRFARQPKICVRMRGDVRLDSVRVVERRNIRSPVSVGTSYRDVYVAVEILGHLNAQCIAARITGQQDDSTCAALGIRDSTSGVRGAPAPGPAAP
jgi:hypothetical protein